MNLLSKKNISFLFKKKPSYLKKIRSKFFNPRIGYCALLSLACYDRKLVALF